MSEQTGGIGYPWFVVEVTSEPVAEGPVAVGITSRLPYNVGSVTVGISRTLRFKLLPTVVQHQIITVGIARNLRYGVLAAPPPQPQVQPGSGGGRTYTQGGGAPLFEPIEFEQKIPSRVEISLPAFSTTVGGKISAVRPFDLAIPTTVSMAKEFEIRLGGARESAERWGTLLKEDEELLLLS